MTQDQSGSPPNEEAALKNGDAGSPLPLRRSGRARKRPSTHSEDADYENGPPATSPDSADTRRNPKRRPAPDAFDVPDNLLEASLGPWKENEQAEWANWIELESDPAFFTAILGLLGIKGARIEEVLSVDEDTLATLPPPVHGLVFLYEYVAEESVEATEPSRDVWFANQTTHNACATIALLNIIMNAEGLSLGEKLRKFKQESKDLAPPLRGHMINNSTWIRTAHNSFARRLDLLDAALCLQNEVDKKKKRAKSAGAKQKKKNPKREKAKTDKSSGISAYHFIAFVPVGQEVWQLDGLTSTPVCIGEYKRDQPWTSVMRPVLQERMMRYETERLSFSLLALCGDNLAHVRQKLAANVRSLADLDAKFGTNPDWQSQTNRTTVIHNPADPRLAAYQLDAVDIGAVPESEIKTKLPRKERQQEVPSSSSPPSSSLPTTSPTTATTTAPAPATNDNNTNNTNNEPPPQPTPETEALNLWMHLTTEQERILAEYDREAKMGMTSGQEPATTALLGRTRDYTAAVHEWVGKLAGHGVLRRLGEEVSLGGTS